MSVTAASGTWRRDLQATLFELDAQSYTEAMIGLKVLPVYRSRFKSAEYPMFPREWFKKLPDSARAADGGYNRVGAQFEQATYTCEDHGNEQALDDFDRNHYGTFFDYEASAALQLFVLEMLLLEKRISDLVMSETTFTATAAATAWATIASATPITDVDNVARIINQASGVPKNQLTLVVNDLDWQYLNNCASILDRIKYVNLAVADEARMRSAIADAMGIKEILVGQTYYDTKEEGIAESMSAVWPANTAGLGRIAPSENVGLGFGCLGRTVLWTTDSPEIPTIETYDEPRVRAEVLRARMSTDEILQGDADVFWSLISTDA